MNPDVIKLHEFVGGMVLPGMRDATADRPVQTLPLSEALYLPLDGQVGLPALPVVTAGERVGRGQLLARAGGYVGAALHAPVQGQIQAIDFPVARPGDRTGPAIVLIPDQSQPAPSAAPVADDVLTMPVTRLLERIAGAGIVGLGGAGFPTAVKLGEGSAAPVDLLVINAVECEPGLTCDQRLVRDHAVDVLLGAIALARVTAAKRCVIALEDDKVAAAQALAAALDDPRVQAWSGAMPSLIQVPSRYPTGAERQLINVLTGIELRPDEVPIHYGVVVQNVATTAAVARAAAAAEPLIQRYVTVLGAVPSPGNFCVPIGTPAIDLLAAAGLDLGRPVRVRFGGPLTGQYVSDLRAPIDKRTAAICVEPGEAQPPERACIRCGACIPVCPSRLHPPALLERLRNRDFDVALDFDLFACIECGLCDHVCPSRIPLSDRFRRGKWDVEAQHRAQQQTDRFRQLVAERPGHRVRREALVAAHRASRRARSALVDGVATAASSSVPEAAGEASDSGSGASSTGLRADIAAAVARVRARRGAGGPAGPDDSEGGT